ncbi:DUF7490 domain-containing protein [Halapricum hydrolyticum]|uniref:PGF-CTERM sorting domain-containing protein n=1 Tax=Halapricum hydrolyticum TaxID=2979991 RepID=A0AAE3LEE0_9EURY|nr:PGF-CTERM sorting domain-containing protein [Halapricum hydrolyticum]MCU4717314.1 PGF-CTERM sorting domain-containing protein [Halapricum hydrolyticum]MCU4726241.1 PGF-CTERM sorting domain-containing protein [Halapricum hydrolyticum]
MQREYALVGAAAVVLAVSILLALVAPGALADIEDDSEPTPDGELRLSEIRLTPLDVSGDSATLTVTNWISHEGGTSENVSLLVRVIDTDTGLVETRARRSIGVLEGDSDDPVGLNVTVERSGGYRFETLVFVDSERRATRSAGIDGIEALQPTTANTGLQFHEFGPLFPTITYDVVASDDGDVTLNTTAFLTNRGDQPADDLQLLVRARQSDSNIVADRATVEVEDVRPGRTSTPTARLSVPDNYSYQLDAILTRDDVIVDTAAAAANLDPTETVDVNRTTRSVDLSVDDFVADEPDDGREREPRTTMTKTGGGDGPGFGVAVALVAVLASTLLLRRIHHD